MKDTKRPEIPQEKIIEVNNSKKIDFTKPFKFIYMDWWYNVITFPLLVVLWVVVALCAVFFGLRVKDRKNMKILRKQGCITISNHCHYFDTVLATWLLYPHFLHVSVAQRNFEVPYVRRILRILRAFPIPASRLGFKLIEGPIGEALKRKHHIHFLPEGDLVHLSQTIYRFKQGAFLQAYKHQAPVLPMVYVMKRRKFFGKLMRPNWVKMTLVIGEPIFPPPLAENEVYPKEAISEMSNKAASWMEETLRKHHQEMAN